MKGKPFFSTQASRSHLQGFVGSDVYICLTQQGEKKQAGWHLFLTLVEQACRFVPRLRHCSSVCAAQAACGLETFDAGVRSGCLADVLHCALITLKLFELTTYVFFFSCKIPPSQ